MNNLIFSLNIYLCYLEARSSTSYIEQEQDTKIHKDKYKYEDNISIVDNMSPTITYDMYTHMGMG